MLINNTYPHLISVLISEQYNLNINIISSTSSQIPSLLFVAIKVYLNVNYFITPLNRRVSSQFSTRPLVFNWSFNELIKIPICMYINLSIIHNLYEEWIISNYILVITPHLQKVVIIVGPLLYQSCPATPLSSNVQVLNSYIIDTSFSLLIS